MTPQDKTDIINAIKSSGRHLEDSMPIVDMGSLTAKLQRIIELLEEIRDNQG